MWITVVHGGQQGAFKPIPKLPPEIPLAAGVVAVRVAGGELLKTGLYDYLPQHYDYRRLNNTI